MRFHLDEHVADAVAKGLRQRGIDVTTTVDASLRDAPDEDHISFGLAERRVVVTQDADFLRFQDLSRDHAGIVFFAQGSRTIGEVVRHVALMHSCMDESDMRGKVEYL